MRTEILKKLVNPFFASVALLVTITAEVVLVSCGFEYSPLLYALVPLPIAILAYTGGFMLSAAAAGIAVLAETLLASALSAGPMSTTFGPFEKFVFMTAIGAAVWSLSCHFRIVIKTESCRAEDYLKKLYLQRKENDSAMDDAESNVQRFREDIDRYSSLVLLLEEVAEKIYSNLDTQALLETFFHVLHKCLNARTGSIYFLDEEGKNYVLHLSFGYGPDNPFNNPDVVPADDPLFAYVAMSRRGIALGEGCMPDPQLAPAALESAVGAVMSAALPEQDKVTGIVNIHSFNDDTPRDSTRDTSLLSTLCNITSIALTNARLFTKIQDMAVRDPLTKLYNRRYFYDRLTAELGKCRIHQTPACVLLCDIDHFKNVNDTYGHQAGDAVLAGFANVCRKIIRDCDILARYGGEEFIFLLPGLAADEGRKAAERIRRAVALSTISFEGSSIRITTSCGLAAFPEHAGDIASLTRAADQALYTAKDSGRNVVAVAGEIATVSFSACDEKACMQHEEAQQ